METKYWAKIKEFHGLQLLRDPESLQTRITPIERPQPLQKPEPEIPEHIKRRAERSWQLHLAGTRQASPVQTVKAEPVLTFEEKVKEDWRTRPNIRAEFTSFGSYQAYKRAEKAGRARVCG